MCSKTSERPLQDLGQEGKQMQAAQVSRSTAGAGTIQPAVVARPHEVPCCCSAS